MKKVYYKIIVLNIIAIFSATILFAQSQEILQKAFRDSYTKEYNKDYPGAIKCLKDVYIDNSYELNLRLGWLCYMNAANADAITYYTRATKLMPYSIEAKLGLVYPQSALSNWDNVIKTYKEILVTDPQNYRALYNLGLTFYNRKEYAEAHKHFEKLANLYPFDFDSVHMLAWCNLRLEKMKDAKILFNRALLISPANESVTEGLKLIK